MVAGACNPSYLEAEAGESREADFAVSQDRTTALRTGWKSETVWKKKEKKKKKENAKDQPVKLEEN